MPVFSGKRPYSIMDDKWYTVVLKVTVWPEIYYGKMAYSFPTEKAAMRFAQGSLSSTISSAQVFSPDNKQIALYMDCRKINNAYNEIPTRKER